MHLKKFGTEGMNPLMLEDAVRRNLWRWLALHYSQHGRALKSVYFNATANCAYRETAELIVGHSGGREETEGRNLEKGERAGPAFLGHVPMGIGISRCVNTSLSRRIEREQSETSTPAHCLRLGINKSIALGYGGCHGNRRPIRALSHSSFLSLPLFLVLFLLPLYATLHPLVVYLRLSSILKHAHSLFSSPASSLFTFLSLFLFHSFTTSASILLISHSLFFLVSILFSFSAY